MTAFTAPKFHAVATTALVILGLGMTIADSATATTPAAAPLACDIAVDQNGHMVSFQGRVQATEDLTGTYSLTLRGGGTNIRQGGAFAADAGDLVTLCQANLSGSPDRYDADLTLSVNGATYNCAVNS